MISAKVAVKETGSNITFRGTSIYSDSSDLLDPIAVSDQECGLSCQSKAAYSERSIPAACSVLSVMLRVSFLALLDPVEDPSNLDARRREMNLQPEQEYLKMLQEACAKIRP